MMKSTILVTSAVLLLLALSSIESAPAFAQTGAPFWAGSTLRGRYHYYNGPHVSFGRGRWGGGISNNGALVLNTLTTTAGAVAPSIVPLFVPGGLAAGIAGTGQSDPGPGDTVGTSLEAARELESLDVNRDSRDKKLSNLDQRSLSLLERLGLRDSDLLHDPSAGLGSAASPAASTEPAVTPPPTRPGELVTPGTLPRPR